MLTALCFVCVRRSENFRDQTQHNTRPIGGSGPAQPLEKKKKLHLHDDSTQIFSETVLTKNNKKGSCWVVLSLSHITNHNIIC